MITQPPPVSIAGFRVIKTLVPDLSFLAESPDARPVVLKKLPDDCIAEHTVHPEILNRLDRILQLPHPAISSLLGIHRHEGTFYAAWEFIPGTPLEEYLAAHPKPKSALASELVNIVQTLHSEGLRHGAIHPRNIIILPDGTLKMTHLSPLLYLDPDIDIQGLLDVLPLLGCRDEIADLDCNSPIRLLSTRVLAWSRGVPIPPETTPLDDKLPTRRLMLLGALFFILASAAIAWYFISIAYPRVPDPTQSPGRTNQREENRP